MSGIYATTVPVMAVHAEVLAAPPVVRAAQPRLSGWRWLPIIAITTIVAAALCWWRSPDTTVPWVFTGAAFTVVCGWLWWACPVAGRITTSTLAALVAVIGMAWLATPRPLPYGVDQLLVWSYWSLILLAGIAAYLLRRPWVRPWVTALVPQVLVVALPLIAPAYPGPTMTITIAVLAGWLTVRRGFPLAVRRRCARRRIARAGGPASDPTPEGWPQLPARYTELHRRRVGRQVLPHVIIGHFGVAPVVDARPGRGITVERAVLSVASQARTITAALGLPARMVFPMVLAGAVDSHVDAAWQPRHTHSHIPVRVLTAGELRGNLARLGATDTTPKVGSRRRAAHRAAALAALRRALPVAADLLLRPERTTPRGG